MTDDAKTIIQATLAQYGLGSLADWAWGQYLNGVSVDQIMLDVRQTPEYKQRYPAMEELAKQGKAISETDYRNYEDTIVSLSRQYGVATDMYATPQGIAKMLVNGVSAKEANDRFQLASVGAISAPQEVKQAYSDLYGLTGGDLIATYLDPDKALPILQRQSAAAQVAGASYLAGTRADLAEAERLADQGVTFDQAVTGYGHAQAYEGLDYAGGMATTRSDRVAAQFGDAQAAARVQQAAAARQAAFQGGGGPQAGQAGVVGLARDTA
jgi:hypothetical protein